MTIIAEIRVIFLETLAMINSLIHKTVMYLITGNFHGLSHSSFVKLKQKHKVGIDVSKVWPWLSVTLTFFLSVVTLSIFRVNQTVNVGNAFHHGQFFQGIIKKKKLVNFIKHDANRKQTIVKTYEQFLQLFIFPTHTVPLLSFKIMDSHLTSMMGRANSKDQKA